MVSATLILQVKSVCSSGQVKSAGYCALHHVKFKCLMTPPTPLHILCQDLRVTPWYHSAVTDAIILLLRVLVIL